MSPPGDNGFMLGSDTLGRDVAAGIAHGARTSLMIGGLATAVAVLLGVMLGALAGYFGGWIDDLLMRVTEMFQTIPSFLFAILIVAIMKPSIQSIVIAIAVVSWPAVARLVRGEFMAMRNREFVQACHIVGMSDLRIILREILPNCHPNVISWGFQIGAGRTVLRSAWWVCTFPGVAILLTVLAINLVGEGLNDALNPRLRERT